MLPLIFFGHGNPMNALQQNAYTESWSALGRTLPRPKAILSISAHWYIPATSVTAMQSPRTIHDFGGFPRELYEVQYQASGDPALAKRVQQLLAPLDISLDARWGLDHGTWAVLCHVYPEADVPVVQLSIDETKPAQFHYELGKKLAPLREEDVLIIGSGNIVHNLHAYAWGRHPVAPLDWAVAFDTEVRRLLTAGNDEALIHYESLGRHAELAVPTPDHYLPLLYIIGARKPGENVSFPVEGFDGGSVSMLCAQIG